MTRKKLMIFVLMCQISTAVETTQDFKKDLIALREIIQKQYSDNNNEASKINVLKKVCNLTNTSDYPSISIYLQSLFASNQFLECIIMQDFNSNQVICLTLQNLAIRMLTNDSVSVDDAIDVFRQHQELKEILHKSDADLEEFVYDFTDIINIEYSKCDEMGMPWFVYEHFSSTVICAACGNEIKHGKKLSLFKRGFKWKFQQLINIASINSDPSIEYIAKLCVKCKVDLYSNFIKYEHFYPHTFIMPYNLCNLDDKDEFRCNRVRFFAKLWLINKHEYQLYAIMRLHIDHEKKLSYPYTIAKKDGDWYKFDNNGFERIIHVNREAESLSAQPDDIFDTIGHILFDKENKKLRGIVVFYYERVQRIN